jgi:hypothetical protein
MCPPKIMPVQARLSPGKQACARTASTIQCRPVKTEIGRNAILVPNTTADMIHRYVSKGEQNAELNE